MTELVVVHEDTGGIAIDQRPAFREYIVREHVPTYTIPDRVIVGTVLPEAGITTQHERRQAKRVEHTTKKRELKKTKSQKRARNPNANAKKKIGNGK